MGKTTNLKLVLVNMGKIINCMFLNPGWEEFHKSHSHRNRNGENKTHEPRVGVATTQENRTKTPKPSFLLFCFSLSNYCMCLHASHYSGRSIPLLSGCQEQFFPAKQPSGLTSQKSGSSHSPGCFMESGPGTGSYILPIDIVGLASLCS